MGAAVGTKDWAIGVLGEADTILEVYGRARDSKARGLLPVQAIGLTGLDRNAAQLVAQALSEPSGKVEEALGTHASAFSQQIKAVVQVMDSHLGVGEEAIRNTPGIFTRISHQLRHAK